MNSGSHDIALFAFVAVAVVSIAGALFGMYVVGRVVRRVVLGVVGVTDGIGRLIVGGPGRPVPPAEGPRQVAARRPRGGWRGVGGTATTLRCPRPRCHAENVPSAKFCRRCGSAMDERAAAARGSAPRRAAMW